MSLIGNCLNKLVKAGKISQKAANDARGIHEGIQQHLTRTMAPADAEAAAALELAKILADGAKVKKLTVAKNAIALSDIEERMMAHPEGPTAGAMAILSRDIHGKATGLNVDTHQEAVLGRLLSKASELDQYESKTAGLTQDTTGIKNVVRELFGEDTGDAAARSASDGWNNAVKYGFDRLGRAGVLVNDLKDWRLPQFWDTVRVRQAEVGRFKEAVNAEIENGGLKVIDKKTGLEANAAQTQAIIAESFEKIKVGLNGHQANNATRNLMRTFRFENAESYLRLMTEFGPGDKGIYGMMAGHLNQVARDIAMSEVMGPSHHLHVRHMIDLAKKAESDTMSSRKVQLPFSRKTITVPPKKALQARRLGMESPAAIDRTYRYLTGQVNEVAGENLAGIGAGIRAFNTATSLGSAVVSAIPGDLATTALTSAFNGMSPMRIVRGIFKAATDGDAQKQMAKRMNIISHSIMDGGIGMKRFEDEVIGDGVAQRVASFVIRSQGLAAWTDMSKRVFSMEMMGDLADISHLKWADLPRAKKDFFERYNITRSEWAKIRTAPLLDFDGAKFFDLEAIPDEKLADKLSGAIIDERHFAVIEPDARIRQFTTGGMQRGTGGGEFFRQAFMFKSFPISMVMTHVMRSAQANSRLGRAGRMATLIGAMTLAGGISLQSRAILTGKDPQQMFDDDYFINPDFALAAFYYGGALGIYGDFINGAQHNRAGNTIIATLQGPPIQMLEDGVGGVKAFSEMIRKAIDGEDQVFGKKLAKNMAKYTPGSNLWYSRLAMDRLVFDTVQTWMDPEYQESFQRERDRLYDRTGQGFWWEPGENLPSRLPEVTSLQ